MDSQKPFWWPDTRGFLAGGIVFVTAAALFLRMLHPSNTEDKMLDTMITILFSTCLVVVYQFFFGSSAGSQSKDETINKMALAPKLDDHSNAGGA